MDRRVGSVRLGAVLVVVVAVLAAIRMVHDSPQGVGVGWDSSHYLSAAEHLRAGDGLDVSFTSGFEPLPTADGLESYGEIPLTHYPPGYPVLLAAGDAALPGGLRGAARAIGVVAVLATVLAAAALARGLGAGPVAAAAVAAVVACGPALQRLSMWILSDAIGGAIALGALAVAARGTSWRTPRGTPLRPGTVALASGLLAAAATTVRFGGVGAAVGASVLLVRLDAGRRACAAVLVRTVGPTVAAMLAMFAINASRGQNAARPVVWHPPGRDDLEVLVDTVGQWVLGDRSKAVLRVTALVAAVAIALAARHLHRPRTAVATAATAEPSPARVGTALGAFAFAQFAVIAFTSALLDADVSFDRRLHYPAELACTVLVVGVVVTRPRRVAVGVALGVVIAVARTQVTTGPYPQGLAVPEPPAVLPAYELVGGEPEDRVIATNVPEFLWAATGRASVVSPASHDKLTDRDVADFDEQLAEMGRLVGARGGVLLVLRTPLPTLTRPDEVARVLPCAAVTFEDEDALVYDLTPCAPGR